MKPPPPGGGNQRQALLWLTAGVLLCLAILGVLIWHYHEPLLVWWGETYRLIADREQVQAWLKAAGPWGPFWFILIQSLQVVLAPIPGEATGFLGGFLFGLPLGFLYSTIGLTLGSVLAFGAGHWLEKRFVVKIVSQETMQRFDFFMDHQGALVAFFLFLFPGFPKDYLCFILGLSPMSFRLFFILVLIGRMPGTLMLTLQGAKVYEGEYLMFAIILTFSLVAGGLMYYYRETAYEWIRRIEETNRHDRTH